MSSNGRVPRGERIAETLSCFGPGPLAGAFVLALVVSETAVLLALDAREVAAIGGGVCLLGAALAYWGWLTAVWLGAGLALRARSVGGAARAVTFVISALVTLVVAALAAGSTSLRVRTGRFVGLDGLRTTLTFSGGGDENFAAIARHELLAALPFLGLTLAVAAAFWIAVAAPGESVADEVVGARRRRARRRAWLYAPLAVLAAHTVVTLGTGGFGGILAWRMMATKLDPLLTLGLSLLDGSGEPPSTASASLAGVALAPIEPGPWRPRDEAQADRWVILVKVESLRADCLGLAPEGRPVTPCLDALARGARVFTRAYAPSTHTDYSDLATLASRYPLRTRGKHYPAADERFPQEPIYETLARAGWRAGLFSSANLAWLRMDWELKTPGLSRFESATSLGARGTSDAFPQAGLGDARTTDAAIAWLEEVAREGRRACLFLDLQGPHYPYLLPESAERVFKPVDESFEGRTIAGYPFDRRAAIRNDYLNAVHAADAHLGRVVAALERLGKSDRAVVAVFGDHGQMFHEVRGYVAHGREPYELAVRTPLVIRAPGVPPGRDDDPVELIDLVPTLLGALGGPVVPGLQGVDLLDPSARPPAARRLVFLHVEHLTSACDAVLAGGRWKLVHDRVSGTVRLHDLASDPLEERDLSAAEPRRRARLESVLGLWRARQLAYHDAPAIHARFHPPRPPRLDEDP